MKCNIIALIVLTGCAFAGATSENRDVTPDLSLASRDGLDVGIESVKASGEDALTGREEVDIDVESRDGLGSVGRSSNIDIEAREPQPPIPPQCPPRRQAVVFLRRGRFPFRTLSFIGFFFQTRRFNTTPLFLVFKRSTGDYFYTTSSTEARHAIRDLGYTNRGIAGFVFVDGRCGGVPLYRTFNGRRRQYFYTTSIAQRNLAKRYGYFNQGITGYIFRI